MELQIPASKSMTTYTVSGHTSAQECESTAREGVEKCSQPCVCVQPCTQLIPICADFSSHSFTMDYARFYDYVIICCMIVQRQYRYSPADGEVLISTSHCCLLIYQRFTNNLVIIHACRLCIGLMKLRSTKRIFA